MNTSNTDHQAGYNDIIDMLLKAGFQLMKKEGDPEYMAIEQQQQVIVINGREETQTHKIEHHIIYIGDGWISDADESNKEDIFGFTCFDRRGGYKSPDVNLWARNWEDFICLLRLRI